MIVGTAGHIDHGKTSLVKALTGVDTDRLKEEKARGITIQLGFAYLPAPDGSVLGFVDVPGHERFIHTMLAGATGIDHGLLGIAADDGIKPQTREHLAILDLLGLDRGVVALTKSDLVEPARLAKVTAEIAALLAGTGLAGAPILPVSTVTGDGIEALREHLLQVSAAHTGRSADGRFRLAVDRSFVLQGAGTVVTGTVLTGSVGVGDALRISPSGLQARVRSIHAQNRPAERGVAGQRCALNLAGEQISKEAVGRGDVVLDPVLHAPTDRIDATLFVLPGEPKPLRAWFPVRLHHAAADVSARLVMLAEDVIVPGSHTRVQLVLDQPIAAAVGDAFVLRDTSAQRTIGGGRFLDLRAPARKRRTPERAAQLDAAALFDPGAVLPALLAVAPWFVEWNGWGRDRCLSAAQMEALAAAQRLVLLPSDAQTIALLPERWTLFAAGMRATLAQFHTDNPDLQGIGVERLRLLSEPRLPAPAFRQALQLLVRDNVVALDGSWVRLPEHSVRLTAADEQLWAAIEPLLGEGERFRPPRVRDIGNLLGVPEAQVRRLCKLLARLGQLDEVAHDHFFRRATVAEMVEILIAVAAAAEGNEFTAAQFRDQVDNGRKVAIQILDFFDRHGVTLRRGDLRRMNNHRLDQFAPAQQDRAVESEPAGKRFVLR